MSISEGLRVPRYGYRVGIRTIDAQRVTRNAPLYLVLAILGAAMIFPFLWMLATSFKPAPEERHLRGHSVHADGADRNADHPVVHHVG